MRLIKTSSFCSVAGLLVQYVSSAPHAAPPVDPPNPPGFDVSVYNSSEALQAVQFNAYIDHLKAAALQYGIDNLPRIGLGKYPPELLDFLKTWKGQTDLNLQLADLVLTTYKKHKVPPCKYTIGVDRIGTVVNSADVYLLALEGILDASHQANLALIDNTVEASPGLGRDGAIAASSNARKMAYIRGIAGVNPAPVLTELVAPNVLTYLFSLYYVKPGTCPLVPPPPKGTPPFPSFRPTIFTGIDPPVPLSPAGAVTAGTTRITFAWNSTVYNAGKPGTEETPLKEKPKYAGFISGAAPPFFAGLRPEGESGASFVVPEQTAGYTYVVLTAVDGAETADGLAKDTLAGPFLINPPRRSSRRDFCSFPIGNTALACSV